MSGDSFYCLNSRANGPLFLCRQLMSGRHSRVIENLLRPLLSCNDSLRDSGLLLVGYHFLVVQVVGFPGLFLLAHCPVRIGQVEVGNDSVRMFLGNVFQQFDCLRIMTGLFEQEAEIVRPFYFLREVVFLDDVVSGGAGAVFVASEEVADKGIQLLLVTGLVGFQGVVEIAGCHPRHQFLRCSCRCLMCEAQRSQCVESAGTIEVGDR